MEFILSFLTSIYNILFLILIAGLVFAALIAEILRTLTINRMRKEQSGTGADVCELLNERFPRSTVYGDVYFLKESAAKEGLSCVCDVVYISRGGVLLLTVLPDVGMYDNPKIGTWRRRYINSTGETVTKQLPNPFESMAFYSSVAEKLLASENILNPSVSRAVVFTANPVDYTKDYPECLTVGTLFDYIEEFDRRRHFKKREYERAYRVISACSDYLEYSKKYHPEAAIDNISDVPQTTQ